MENIKKTERAIFILAAGKSTRFNSKLPKILHLLGGRPVLDYLIETAYELSDDIFVITAPDFPSTYVPPVPITFVTQFFPKGTGDAFLCGFKAFRDKMPQAKEILILLGDCPLILPKDLESLFDAKRRNSKAVMAVLGMERENPSGYGRLKTQGDRLLKIIEEKNASLEEKRINFCNSGVMLVNIEFIEQYVADLAVDKVSEEIYITDLVCIANQYNFKVVVAQGKEDSLQGINTRKDFVSAEQMLQTRFREKALTAGATLYDPATTYLSYDTKITADVIIHPCVHLGPGVSIEEGVEIFPFSCISHSHIQEGSRIGPFARLRGGNSIGKRVVIGSFVEIKHSTLNEDTKAGHLAYIGDAQVGASVNFGAGIVTCNFDGHQKFQTIIGDETFIGSNSALVAPLVIGNCSTIGAGSIITKEVPSKTLAVSRVSQKNIHLTSDSKHLKRGNKG